MNQHALDAHAAGRWGQHVADRLLWTLRDRQVLAITYREHRGDDVGARGLAAGTVTLPLLVCAVQDHRERRGATRDADLELGLVAGVTHAHHALVAGERHTLRPGP